MYKNIKGKHDLSVTLHDGKTKTYDQLFDEFIYTTGRKLRVGCEGSWDLKMSHLSHMSIEFDAVGGSSFAFGHLSCAKLSLGVTYEKPISKYDVLKPYAELYVTYINIHGDIEEEWLKVPLGVFIVDEVKSGYLSKEITAYDYAYWYDAGDMTDFPNYNAKGGTDNNSFYFKNTKDGDINIANTTLETVINYINNSSDFAAIKARTNNSGKIIDMDSNLLGLSNYKSLKLFDLGDNFTLRGFIGYLAGLRGRNAIFNRDGKLEFRPINGNSLKTYKRSQYGSFSEDDTPMITNKLTSQYMIMKTNTADDGTKSDELTTNTISYTPGFDKINEYAFVNPLITSETQLGHVYNAIKTTGRNDNYYIPCKLSMIGDPRLDINDIITVIRRKKNTDGTRTDSPIDIPIMKMKMKLNSGCSLEIESVADSTNGQTGGLTGSISKTLEKTTSMTKGMFNELYGVDGTFGTLFANEGKIGTFVAGKITASRAEIDEIIATKASIEDLAAGNLVVNAAKITNLKADAIQGGTLDLNKGITIGSGDGVKDENGNTIKSDTLSITNNSITMNSPKVDSEGHPLGANQERLFIGKRNSDGNAEYTIEIHNAKGEKLWGAEGLTSSAVNNLESGTINGSIMGEGTIHDNAIESLHATKVLVSKTFADADTDETDTHTSLYNYLKHFNGNNVKVEDKNNTEYDLQTYLDNLDDRNTTSSNENSQKFNKINERLDSIETKNQVQDAGISDNKNSINNIQQTLFEYNITNVKQTTDIENNARDIEDINGKLTQHDNSLVQHKKDIDSNSNNIAHINSTLNNHESRIYANENNINLINEKLGQHDTSIGNISTSLSNKVGVDNIISSIINSKETIPGSSEFLKISSDKLALTSVVEENARLISQKVNSDKVIDVINSDESDKKISSDKIELRYNMTVLHEETSYSLDNYIKSLIQSDEIITIQSDEIITGLQNKVVDLEDTITQLLDRIAVLESYHTTTELEELENPEQTE